MLVNIWGTIIHLSDSFFGGALDTTKPSLDLLICERLNDRITNHRGQTWMINPVWHQPGTTAVLLRESYHTIQDSEECFIMLLTPGFADVVNEVPFELVGRYITQIAKRSRILNKRLVTTLIGIPPACPDNYCKKIEEINRVTEKITMKREGVVVDLRSLSYSEWEAQGSKPTDLDAAAVLICEGILNSHASIDAWKKLHGLI
jgi:hypothetical protein